MKIDPLIKMANQISDFFDAESTPEDAPKMIATHMRRYWEARMRKEIIAYVERDGGEGLDESALAAVRILAAEPPPIAQAPAAKS